MVTNRSVQLLFYFTSLPDGLQFPKPSDLIPNYSLTIQLVEYSRDSDKTAMNIKEITWPKPTLCGLGRRSSPGKIPRAHIAMGGRESKRASLVALCFNLKWPKPNVHCQVFLGCDASEFLQLFVRLSRMPTGLPGGVTGVTEQLLSLCCWLELPLILTDSSPMKS